MAVKRKSVFLSNSLPCNRCSVKDQSLQGFFDPRPFPSHTYADAFLLQLGLFIGKALHHSVHARSLFGEFENHGSRCVLNSSEFNDDVLGINNGFVWWW